MRNVDKQDNLVRAFKALLKKNALAHKAILLYR